MGPPTARSRLARLGLCFLLHFISVDCTQLLGMCLFSSIRTLVQGQRPQGRPWAQQAWFRQGTLSPIGKSAFLVQAHCAHETRVPASQGDCALIFSPNCIDYAVAFHGVASVGGVVTTANPAYNADELSHQLKDCNAKFVFTSDKMMDVVVAAIEKQPGVTHVFTWEGEDTGRDNMLVGTCLEATCHLVLATTYHAFLNARAQQGRTIRQPPRQRWLRVPQG